MVDLAKTIRSKTLVLTESPLTSFSGTGNYELVKKSKCLTRDTVAKIFDIPASRIVDFVEFDPANAIKFTINRLVPSGSFGEGDVFGCQQYPPLLDIEIPLDDES